MMSDYNYSLSKDTTTAAKAVPLYHHEQVPFHSFQRQQSISTNNTSSPIVTASAVNVSNYRNNNNMNNSSASPVMNNLKEQNSVSGDLQDIIYSYQSQPELLRLILLSKLEEDKRRAEEAKLRAKELDLVLLQQQQQQQLISTGGGVGGNNNITNNSNTNDVSMSSFSQQQSTSSNNNTFQQQQQQNTFNTSCTSTVTANTNFTTMQQHPTPPISSSNSSTDGRTTFHHHMRRTSLDAILSTSSPTSTTVAYCTTPNNNNSLMQQHRRDSTLGSSFTGSADSDEYDDRTFSPIHTSSSTTTPVSASSLLKMDSYGSAAAAVMSSMSPLKQHPLSPGSYLEDTNDYLHHQLDTRMLSTTPQHQQPQQQRYDFPPRPRRRREMQAITKIVETREYPYIDGYFWKNNGNTVQKKTGNKSVYYKCSNSNKGCPVNKTVTWKDHGEYLIKYRGEHLMDCNKVQRIVDV